VYAALLLTLAAIVSLPACRRAAPQETEAEPAIPVIAEPVRLGAIRATISATGVVTTLPGAAFDVVASQPARIAEITKNVGDTVKSGEMLVRFEFPSLRAQSAVSEAAMKAADLRVKQAQLTQSRVRMLVDKGAASRVEADAADRELADAEGELAVAKAALGAVQAQGGNTIILAPFDGTVTERLHNPGDAVRADAGDPILRLIDPRQVQVTVVLPVPETTRFVVGASARATAEGYSKTDLLRVATRPAPESGAKTVEVTLAFDTPTELKPGTQVGVEIDGEQRSNVPLVPSVAVIRDNPAQPIVVVAAGGVVQRRAVVIGLVDTENIEILSGLKPGELIITQGHSTLRDGTPVSVSAP
jgi:cobalt-zinc-cadmium efflux system membrane fusion protein